MKRFNSLLILVLFPVTLFPKDISTYDLSCEHRRNPIGIDILQPLLSWKINAAGMDVMQVAYSLRVSADSRFTSSAIVWQTGKILSDQSVYVRYNGPELKPGLRYYWQVKVWDNKGRDSEWSETCWWETGLINHSGWKAQWIELEGDTIRYSPAVHFRKELTISKGILSARVYVTSHGFYELHINGKKTGDQVLTPGWTSYLKRLQYQVYDVTPMLTKGVNTLGAVLGDGWYRGTLAWGNNWAIYGRRLGLLLQMRIKYTDGSEELYVTDNSWKGIIEGAITMDDIYNGETYDSGRKLVGWDLSGFNDSGWKSVKVGNYPLNNLIASEGPAIRKIQEIKPVRIFRTPKGSLIADMGQNMVGWIRLKVKGPAGTVITLRHAEVLDKFGEFYTENLRSAKATLTYTLNGIGEEIYEPRFTFMGFRYVEVSGFPGDPGPDNLTGVVIHSDMIKTGSYECSEPLLNQLQHNIEWGQKGNFVDVPTDCPQRDERLGWTGDAQAFCRTASFNYNVAAFFSKWLKDVAADQRPNGAVPVVIPDVLDKQGSQITTPSAGWGDVAVIAPWTMYLVYGDLKFLETQYLSMKAWVEYIRNKAGDSYIWKGGSLFGDWLFYHPPVNNHTEADGFTELDFIATAFYAYSTKLLERTAKVLGKTEDEKMYGVLFEKIKQVFINEYVTPAGRVGTNSQTSYVLALQFDLLPENIREKAARFLVDDIRSRRNHLSTGFLGTVFLCNVLTREGYSDVAYDLLLQQTYPSWLYPVKMGATTIWERWDGQKTDSTFQDAGMNSFNHYAYGAIGDWMYRVSAGIEEKEPGFKHVLIQPHPSKKLQFSRATFESQYGKIVSSWERKDGKIKITVAIPVNTIATVMLPVDDPGKILMNGSPVPSEKKDKITTETKREGVYLGINTGSGEYIFEILDNQIK